MTGVARRGVFPGSFNPLTIAHLEIARIARESHGLDEVVLIVSKVALDKSTPPGPPLAERIRLIEADLAQYPWLSVAQTQDQLIADIAHGFDAVIMGADKWEQVNDVRYYGSTEAKDEAISRLPKVLVAYRDGSVAPEDHTIVTPEELRSVSSSKARAGERNLMAPHARKHWDE